MHIRRPFALLLATVAIGGVSRAHAAVLNVTAAVTQMTDYQATTGSTTDHVAINTALATSAPHDYKITYSIQVADLTGDEMGFGNLALNINLPAGLTRSTVPAHRNYLPSGATANQFGSPAQIFSIDADQGTDPTDLQGIVVSLGSGINPHDTSADDGDRNYQLAAINDGFVPIGSLWVSYSGGIRTTLVPDFYEWSVSVGNPTTLVKVGSDNISPMSQFTIGGFMPEPGSLALLGAAALPLIARRRRR